MIMVVAIGVLEAGAPVIEGVALDRTLLLQQLQRAVDGGERHLRIDHMGAVIDLVGVRMVGRIGDHAQDHLALLGHAHAG
jgi:hypothetical protein